MHLEFLYSLAAPLIILVVVLGLLPSITRRSLGKPDDMMRETRQRLDEARQEQREFQGQLLTELRRHNSAMERQADVLARVLEHLDSETMKR